MEKTAEQLAKELAATFEAFKVANNEALSAQKKDILLEIKADDLNNQITKLQTEIAALTTKSQERIDQLETMVNAGDRSSGSEARDYEAEAKVWFAGKSGQTEFANFGPAQTEQYTAYSKNFANVLKRGVSGNAVQALMSVGSEPDGGLWVPTQQSNQIIKRIFDTSPMRQVASVLSITTDSIEFPNDVNDAVTGGWVGEYDSRAVTNTPKVGNQTIYVREQYAMPSVTQKLLDMASINVESWLMEKIADKMSRDENTAFVNGDGTAKPRGFLDYRTAAVTTADGTRAWGTLQYVGTGTSGGFPSLSNGGVNPDSLIDLVAALKPAYRAGAVFAMNRLTEATIRKMRDRDGNYIVAPLTSGLGFTLLGYPIVIMEDMASIGANSYSIAFGNFKAGYQIVDGRGIRVLRDNLTSKGNVLFYTTKWTGGDILNFDAIKLLKFA
jgi:HK97 family phage major capsid protein